MGAWIRARSRLAVARAIPFLIATWAITQPVSADGPAYCWTTALSKPGTKLAVMTLDGHFHKGPLEACTPEGLSLKTVGGIVQLLKHEVAVLRSPGPFGDYQTVYAPWTNLQPLAGGEEVRVVFHDLSDHHGVLMRVEADGITIMRKSREEFIDRARIRKVRVLVKRERDKAVAVGQTVGFLLALASLAAALSGAGGGSYEIPDGSTDMLEVAGVAGGKAGHEIGRMFDQYQTIYVTPRK